MKSDFYTAIAQIAAERGIPSEAVLSSVEHALKSVYKKMANTEEEVAVESTRPAAPCASLPSRKWSVERRRSAHARCRWPSAMPTRPIRGRQRHSHRELTPENFGRIAAQTVKQVVLQRIRDYERDTVFEEFHDKQGEVLNGVVQRADPRAVIVELGKAEAVMPAREQVPNERYRPGQRVKVLLVEVNKDQRGSAADRLPLPSGADSPPLRAGGAGDLLRRGGDHGGCPRAGSPLQGRRRRATGEGRSGGRLRRRARGAHPEHRQRALRREDRRHRVVPDTAQFIANALSRPSRRRQLDEPNKVATVIVPTDQMSLAIGKEGQNARLAYKLTGWRIDIKDPAALQEMDEELLRQARAAMADSQSDDFSWQGRQPRLVRTDGTISVREKTFGPLAPELVGMSVDVDMRGPSWKSSTIAICGTASILRPGQPLALEDEPVAVAAGARISKRGIVARFRRLRSGETGRSLSGVLTPAGALAPLSVHLPHAASGTRGPAIRSTSRSGCALPVASTMSSAGCTASCGPGRRGGARSHRAPEWPRRLPLRPGRLLGEGARLRAYWLGH